MARLLPLLAGLVVLASIVPWMTPMPVEGGATWRARIRRAGPIVKIKVLAHKLRNKIRSLGDMDMTGNGDAPAIWVGPLLSLMKQVEEGGEEIDRRLSLISPSVADSVMVAASQRGITKKLISKYRKSPSTANCNDFFVEAKNSCTVAEDLYHRHEATVAKRFYLKAMDSFQDGLDCYSARVARALSRDPMASPSFGLAGLTSGQDKGIFDWFEVYRMASIHMGTLRNRTYVMWRTMNRLERAVNYILSILDGVGVEVEEAAEEEALGELADIASEEAKDGKDESADNVGKTNKVGELVSEVASTAGDMLEQSDQPQDENNQPQAATTKSDLLEGTGLSADMKRELEKIILRIAGGRKEAMTGSDSKIDEVGEDEDSAISTEAGTKSAAVRALEKTLADVVQGMKESGQQIP